MSQGPDGIKEQQNRTGKLPNGTFHPAGEQHRDMDQGETSSQAGGQSCHPPGPGTCHQETTGRDGRHSRYLASGGFQQARHFVGAGKDNYENTENPQYQGSRCDEIDHKCAKYDGGKDPDHTFSPLI
jgi:hypothetical protein